MSPVNQLRIWIAVIAVSAIVAGTVIAMRITETSQTGVAMPTEND
jgi:hypothetical protein